MWCYSLFVSFNNKKEKNKIKSRAICCSSRSNQKVRRRDSSRFTCIIFDDEMTRRATFLGTASSALTLDLRERRQGAGRPPHTVISDESDYVKTLVSRRKAVTLFWSAPIRGRNHVQKKRSFGTEKTFHEIVPFWRAGNNMERKISWVLPTVSTSFLFFFLT